MIRLAGRYVIKKTQLLVTLWISSGLLFISSASSVAYSIHRNAKAKAADLAPQNLTPIAKRTASTYSVRDIVRANLFGDPTPPKTQTKAIPKTTLKLKAIGIFWSTDGTKARAIVQSGNKPANIYATGADIKGSGATISEILKDAIILDRNGTKERLVLEMPIAATLTTPESTLDSDLAKSSHDLSSEILRSPDQPLSPEQLMTEFRASREAIRKIRSKALSNSSSAKSQ